MVWALVAGYESPKHHHKRAGNKNLILMEKAKPRNTKEQCKRSPCAA